jgi:hypothetical protein
MIDFRLYRGLVRGMKINGEPAKVVLPYLQRANELKKHDHLAAYNCEGFCNSLVWSRGFGT